MNWARLAVLSQFMRSNSVMAPALRLSILPLLDSIVSELQTEPLELYELRFKLEVDEFVPGVSRLPEAWRQYLIDAQRFIDTRYFQRHTSAAVAPAASAALTPAQHASTKCQLKAE
jgi:hypothetical protein